MSELKPGCQLGEFELLAELGRGGMGTVFRARHVNLDREVALKVVLPHVSAQPGYAERFLREARAAAKVTHAHVIAVHDVREIEGRLVMSLELVRGGDAARFLREQGGKLPERRALEIVRDCARGLVALEEAGLVHRDIKPSNVFLADDGTAKLADLGLARATDPGDERLTQTGMVIGTPAYMSPEQANGKTDIDVRSDVHALGGTLYELLTGSPPYRGSSPMAVITKVLTAPVPDPREREPGISEATAALVQKALAKQRAKRHQSASELLRALERALAGLEAAPTEPGVTRPRRSSEGSPGLIDRVPFLPALAAGGILLSGVLGLLLVKKLAASSAPAQAAPRPTAPVEKPPPIEPIPPPVVTKAEPKVAPPDEPTEAEMARREQEMAEKERKWLEELEGAGGGAPRQEEPPLAPAPLPWRGGPGTAELRPRALPRRPSPEVPWLFPTRREWTTTAPRIVVRGSSTQRVLATSASGTPTSAAPDAERSFALTLSLELGENRFQVRLDERPPTTLVVQRVAPLSGQDFKRTYLEATSSAARIELIRRLDLGTTVGRDLALDFVLKTCDADLREAAIDALASQPPEALGWIEGTLGQTRDPVILEGLLAALGRSGDPRWVPRIIQHLGARKMVVKGSAIRALGRLGTPDGVAALTSAVEHGLDRGEPRVTRALRQSLAALGKPVTVPDPGEESFEAVSAGVRLSVRTRGLSTQGKGSLPMFVLAPPGLSSELFVPYLRSLEETNPITYVELPGKEGLPPEVGVYAVSLLVDALEDLRVALVGSRRIQDKPFGIMAHGLAGWVAMSYAAKFPKKVRRQVLIAVPSGSEAWRVGLARLKDRGKELGDREMEQLPASGAELYFPDRSPELARKAISLLFADARDLEIVRARGPLVDGSRWWIQRPCGDLRLPDFSLFRLDRTPTATLIMHGGLSLLCAVEDADAIAKHYQPAAKVLVFKRSSDAPWIEEEAPFVEYVQRFLGSYKTR